MELLKTMCVLEIWKNLCAIIRVARFWEFLQRCCYEARDATAAVETCQLYFANKSDRFHDVVLASHGSHIPFAIRSVATCLFWLPELLSHVQRAEIRRALLCKVAMPL